MKKIILGIVISLFFTTSMTYAEGIPSSHWAYTLENSLVNEGVLSGDDQLTVKAHVSDSFFYKAVYNAFNQPSVLNGTGGPITRLNAVKFLIKTRGYESLTKNVRDLSTGFADVSTDSEWVYVAQKLGYIPLSSDGKFRPNDLLKTEEALSWLYRVVRSENHPLETLHAYYAIKSYDQIALTKDLDALSMGWARLEMDENNHLKINTTSAGNNEYRIPTGSEIVFEETVALEGQRYLMIFVEETRIAQGDNSVRLAELALSDQYRDETIDVILEVLETQPQFDGVLMDFELLKGKENATRYSLFLEKLNKRLGEKKLKLITAVHPARRNNQLYYDGYDFKKIGAVSDYVVLMAHDYYSRKLTEAEMNMGYTLTPLTPLNEIFDALDLLCDPILGVEDRKKVLLQFSMDTVMWEVVEGKITNAVPKHPSFGTLFNWLEAGDTEVYIPSLGSSKLVHIDEETKVKNVVWYESEKSILAKKALAKAFGIGGISVWRLGTIPSYSGANASLDLWKVFIQR